MPRVQHSSIPAWLWVVALLATPGLSMVAAQQVASQCPPTWDPVERKCFKKVFTYSSFLEAADACSELGGSIAAIHSPEQQASADSLCHNCWIGLTRLFGGTPSAADLPPLQWLSGPPAPVHFDATDPYSPRSSTEHCTTLGSSGWFPEQCAASRQALCERDIERGTVTHTIEATCEGGGCTATAAFVDLFDPTGDGVLKFAAVTTSVQHLGMDGVTRCVVFVLVFRLG